MTAVVEAFKERKAVHKRFEETKNAEGPRKRHCDNEACITIAHDVGYSGRAKHIEIRFFAIQDVINHREVDLVYCASAENNAEILTVAVLPQSHKDTAIRLSRSALQ